VDLFFLYLKNTALLVAAVWKGGLICTQILLVFFFIIFTMTNQFIKRIDSGAEK
jgi:hypothetical protein